MKAKDFKALSKQIEMTITPEGLRIELLESKNGTFFDSGSANLNDDGREILGMLAKQLGAVPNRLSIEGHTDSQPYSNASGYSNWELSADRANAARRIMQSTGVRADQVSQVRGYADQHLRLPQAPLDPSNRRISLIVNYVEGQPLQKLGKEVRATPLNRLPGKSAAAPPAQPAATKAAPPPPAPAPSLTKLWLSKLHHH